MGCETVAPAIGRLRVPAATNLIRRLGNDQMRDSGIVVPAGMVSSKTGGCSPNRAPAAEDAVEGVDMERSTLERFVLRARYVACHSLASDRRRLRDLSKHSFRVRVLHVPGEVDRQSVMPLELLPSEQVESAAARLRPLFLQKDGVHYRDALAELRESASSQWLEKIDECAERFELVEPTPQPKNPRPSRRGVSTAELATAWLYGSLIHDDTKRKSYAAGVDLELAYLVASRVTCGQIVAVLTALDLIEAVNDSGEQVVSPDVFTAQVAVAAGEYVPRGVMAGFRSDDGELDERVWRAIHRGDKEWDAATDLAHCGRSSSGGPQSLS